MGLDSKRISRLDMDARKRLAKRMSPARLWERWGYPVIRASENELRVLDPESGDCLYRSARKNDGTWISGMKDAGCAIASGVGDNISLWQHFEPYHLKRTRQIRSVDFRTTLVMILSICDADDAPGHCARPEAEERFPSLPLPSSQARRQGLDYLAARGISEDCVEMFERQGVLRFCGYSDPAMFFVGKDHEGRISFVSRRSFEDGPMSKRDLSGTRKAMVPVFLGTSTMVFVEGGVNMLTIGEIAKRMGQECPTVVMTGGQANLSWERNLFLERLLKGAARIVFMEENDFHLPEDKRLAGVERKRAQAALAERISGLAVEMCPVDPAYNDINDLLCDFPEDSPQLSQVGECLFGIAPKENPAC